MIDHIELVKNKYSKWYFLFIDSRKHRTIPKTTYTEIHHILPKSIGGSELKDNLIKLTAKEHFFAHLLLAKMFLGVSGIKMVTAINAMKNLNVTGKRYICNSREFKIIKELNRNIFQSVAKDYTNERQLQGEILSQYTDVTKVLERGVCKACGILPKAINYIKNNKIYYRSVCDTCSGQKAKPSVPAWMIQGYQKKYKCECCGFKAAFKEQLAVTTVDSKFKTICLNCQVALTLGNNLEFKGDLLPDF